MTRGFFQELRRRRVFRIAALYIVGAWVVLQVADLAFPGFQIPESAIRYVWIAAVLGFPVALVLGWRFDVAGGRIVRTPVDGTAVQAVLSRSDHVILAAMGLVLLTLVMGSGIKILETRETSDQGSPVTGIDPKSIAVLPFTNISGDKTNEPFTVGIHDDVLTHISKIGDIKVISRTSVARLDPGLSIREIGLLLGVATVLESGVQRLGNRVRINAQLIDTATDQHLWAETYDRELTTRHIFAIQSEIAAAISSKLKVSLSQREEENLNKVQTENLQAYEAYLLGKQRMAIRTGAELLEARDYFERAVALDPQYALAWVGVGDANLLLANYGFSTMDDVLPRVDFSLARAFAIDDQLGAAYASKGLSLVRQGDNAGAEIAFRRAIELDPNNPTPYHWYGDLLLNALAEPEIAIGLLEEARELDPLSPIINITLGEAFEATGRFTESQALYRKVIEIEPDFPAAYFLMALHFRSVTGEMDQALRWHHWELAIDPSRDSSFLGMLYLDLGDDSKAEYWINDALEKHPDWYLPHSAKLFMHRYREEKAPALELARWLLTRFPGNNTSLLTLVTYGRYQEAIDTVASQYPELACGVEPDVNRTNLSVAINLSLAWQEIGEAECAALLLDKTQELIQELPRLGPRGFGFADVEIYARQGRTRPALDALRQAIDEGIRWYWWAQGRDSPHTVSLRAEPEFIGMMQEIQADMDEQLVRVRELEAGDELDSIPLR